MAKRSSPRSGPAGRPAKADGAPSGRDEATTNDPEAIVALPLPLLRELARRLDPARGTWRWYPAPEAPRDPE